MNDFLKENNKMKRSTINFIFISLWTDVENACHSLNLGVFNDPVSIEKYKELVYTCKDFLKHYNLKDSGQFRYELKYLEYLLVRESISQ